MLPDSPLSPVLIDSIPKVHKELSNLRALSFDDFMDKLVNSVVDFAINLGIALLVFYVGKFIIKKLYGLTAAILVRRRVDTSLSTFVLSLINMVLYFILIVTVIGILGIETSSFIAIFASAGVALGMAMSGTLQNFAGGVLILLLKPYKVGDYIEAQGFAGTVTEIQIFHTILNTYDNKSIIIPNGGLSTGSINNWSREEYRRIDWKFSISYGDQVKTARKAVLAIFASDDRLVRNTLEEDRAKRYLAEHPGESLPTTEEASGEVKEEEEEAPKTSKGTSDRKLSFWHKLLHWHRKAALPDVSSWQDVRVARALATNSAVSRAPVVVVDSMGDSSVNLIARAWTRSDFYWPVYYQLNERIYSELPLSGVTFPFPQMDVHLQAPPQAQRHS